MTKNKAHNGPSNAGSRAGPNSEQELDKLARLNAQMLPPQPLMLEADRHGYPTPPQRLHKGNVPTGGPGGGHLHQRSPTS
jgi:hypothetical protein